MQTAIPIIHRYSKTKYSGVRKAPNGRYQISFYPYKGAKKKVYRTIEAQTAKEAEYKRAELLVESRKQWSFWQNDVERANASFDDIWKYLEQNLIADGLPEKTVHHYRRTYGRLFTTFRQKYYPSIQKTSQLRLSFFEQYKDHYCGELGRLSGWRAELIFVKSTIKRLYRLGCCSEEILKKLEQLKRPKARKKEYPDIAREKMAALLDYMRDRWRDIWLVVKFIAKTGRRIEETTLIERADIVWQGTKPVKINIRAKTTKTDEPAPLTYLDEELEELIKEAFGQSVKHKSPYLFLNCFNKKMNQKMVRKCLKLASKEVIGIEITPHYFRHRFCTECAKAQLPIADVMAISGIRDTKVLMSYYTHSTTSGQSKVFAKTGS